MMTFDDHVEALSNKLSKRIGLFKKIKSFLPYNERLTYYTATIKPVIMYGSAVWTLTSKSNIETIFKLQKRAARLILDADCKSRSLPLFNQLKWIPFYEESKINRLSLLLKRIYGNVPSYLTDILKLNSSNHDKSLRHSNLNISCPKYKRQTEGGRTFTTSSIKDWNNLPLTFKKSPSIKYFKSNLINTVLTYQINNKQFYSI